MLHSLWFKLENYSGKDFGAMGFNSFRERKEFLETNYIMFQLSQVICLFVFPFDLFQLLGMVPSNHTHIELDKTGGAKERILRCANAV